MLRSEIHILLADDHPILLAGLQQELQAIGYSHIICAKDGIEAFAIIEDGKIDIALLDIEMPGLSGFEIARKCNDSDIRIPIIFLSYHKEKNYLAIARKMGVRGYMLKEDPINDINNCINHILQGDSFYSRSIERSIFQDIDGQLSDLQFLTSSEKTILKHLSKGNSSQQIADLLSVSKRTVEKHRSNIKAKISTDSEHFSLSKWATSNADLLKNLT